MFRVLVVLFALSVSAFAQEFQTGKILQFSSFESVDIQGGTMIVAAPGIPGVLAPKKTIYVTYDMEIEADGKRYICDQTMEKPGKKAPRFTVGSEVKFQIKKKTLIAIDEAGRKFKFRLRTPSAE